MGCPTGHKNGEAARSRLSVSLPPELEKEIRRAVGVPTTISSFFVEAARDKLDRLKASQARHRRRRSSNLTVS